jgi:hypothetical protein
VGPLPPIPMQLDTVPSHSVSSFDSDGADALAPLRVVIAYDGIPAGRRALEMLNRILKQDHEAVHLFPTLWRFDLLDNPESRARAIADALAADLLILSASAPDVIPDTVENWVSVFLSRSRETSTAILALFGTEDEWKISIHEAVSGVTTPTRTGRNAVTATRPLCRAS